MGSRRLERGGSQSDGGGGKLNRKISKFMRIYAAPVVAGILYLAAESFMARFFSPALEILGISFVLLGALTTLILLLARNFTACASLMVTLHVISLALLLIGYAAHPSAILNEAAVVVLAESWTVIFALCVTIRFFQRNRHIENFGAFFKVSSVIFLILYLCVFCYALFFYVGRGFTTQYHIRKVNLIPFVNTIVPYMTGTSRGGIYIAAENMLANILLFVPIGFYAGIFFGKTKRGARVAAIVGVPVAVEVLQYIFGRGISDIDDVIVNSFGGLLGLFLCLVAERLYGIYQKTGDGRLLTFSAK